MTRLNDTMMPTNTAWSVGQTHRMANVAYSGVYGWAANPRVWQNKTGYVRRHTLPFVLRPPAGFRFLPNPESWYVGLRNIFETMPLTIEGINATISVQASETPYGGAGEQFQDPTNVTRERTSPQFQIPDVYGAPVNRFLEDWITYLIMDPETKTAMVNTLGRDIPPDMLADIYTMDMLFVEPDPQQAQVVRAAIVYNMFPLSGGEVVYRRDITNDMDQIRYNIPMAGFAQHGNGVKAFAQNILNGLRVAGANPLQRQTYLEGIDADILRAKVGLGAQMAELSDQQIRV